MSTIALESFLYSKSDSGSFKIESKPVEFDAPSYSYGQQSVTIKPDIPDDFLEAMAEYQASNLLDFDQVLEEENGPDSV